MSSRKNIELMAPVGSYESLAAAVKAGADAVYFGVGKMNMRSRSSNNFSVEDLKQIADYCRENYVKSYLTVNTVVYDEEISEMKKIIEAAKENNISAVIASDIAVMKYARQIGVEVHASTQLNISNIEAVAFFSEYCDVMVTARELNLDQVGYISEQIRNRNIKGPNGEPIKIEIFCHGALCMAISGKCYLSLHEYNYSANRGACLQTCRRAYVVTDKETGAELEIDNEYIMSPKDLCTISFIDKIIGAGVTVLKIEGRARSPEYVKEVVECYDEAIKAYFNGDYKSEKIETWKKRLEAVFNRGFWDGYYLGKKIGEWSEVYGSKAAKRKVFIGKVTNYFGKIGVAEVLFETAESLSVEDEILITGTTTGAHIQNVDELRTEHDPVNSVGQKDLFSIKVSNIVRRGDKLYKLVDNQE
jgi:U32 family peptidase